MTEIMKEIPGNVNPIITRSTGNSVIQYPKKDVVHRYTKRSSREVLRLIDGKSSEECLKIIRRVGEIQMFPGTMLTNREEVETFFEAELGRGTLHGIKANLGGPKATENCMPVWNGNKFIAMMDKVSPGVKQYRSGDYLYYETENGKAIRGCNLLAIPSFQTINPNGIILLAYCLANGHSEDRRRVAKLLVDECEKSGLFDPPKPKLEPVEIPVIGESKLDYPETITKAFIAMMTLLVKVSEEHGAEKLIQKLKEEGKL